MTGEDTLPSSKNKAVSARRIGFYFALMAFFAPAFALMYWSPPSYPTFQIWGMLWYLYYSIEQGGWYLDLYSPFFAIGQSMLYTLLRPVFAYQMVRFYQGESDKRQTLLVGLFIELQALILDVPAILYHSFYIFHLPIPLLLLAAVLVMRFAPPQPRDISWVEKEQGQSKWWRSEHDDESETRSSKARARFLSVATLNKVLGTILAAEIILIIIGSLIAVTLDSWPLRYYYGQAVPWFILITGLLFLMTRPLRRGQNQNLQVPS